jgi:hypothetical protein
VKLSIIIPTKDRAEEIKSTITFLNYNIFFFNELIIIDSSEKKNDLKCYIKKFDFKIKYYNSKPSISLQRNIGLKNIDKNNDFVMFLDDDIKFNKSSLHKMKIFIENNHQKYVGFGFNLITNDKIKKNRNNFLNIFNIYSNKYGAVSQSGWHSLAFNLNRDTVVEWLSTQAVIYNKDKIKNIFFDEFFQDYSYLEDLDFSYSLKYIGKLIVVADAKYCHKNDLDRSSFSFGEKEIINRRYFVKKHKLNFKLFLLASILKTTSNILQFKFERVWGNIFALMNLKKLTKKIGL